MRDVTPLQDIVKQPRLAFQDVSGGFHLQNDFMTASEEARLECAARRPTRCRLGSEPIRKGGALQRSSNAIPIELVHRVLRCRRRT